MSESDAAGSASAASKPAIVLNLPVTEQPGDRIGRYKLLQQLGEGACGIVYMAEQERPVRRRVAVKVIKLGMDTKSVIARFEAVGVAAGSFGPKRQPSDEFKFLKGLVEYRESHFAKASEWLQKIDLPHLDQWHGVQSYMVLAMAQHNLNQDETAEATLTKGLDIARMNAIKGKGRDFGLNWTESIIAQALVREAKGVVQKHDTSQ